jgi:electron transport complex protein RnfD
MPLKINNSPHLESPLTTRKIMMQVIIALMPAVIFSFIFFKHHAIFLIANCVITAMLTEEIITRLRKKDSTLNDLSAIVTGLLLSLILPPGTKWYAATLGSLFAIAVGKQIFGGLGANIFNPALIGRAFLVAAYPKLLTTFVEPFAVDTISKATPLALSKFSRIFTPIADLFWGNVPGSLGETSAFCLIIGGVYLLIRKIADWRVPISLLITTILFSAIMQIINTQNGSVLFHLFSGGLMLGVFFMVTDPVTTPITKSGRYIFGIGCGLILMTIRYFGGYPEGVMYSIIFMNAVTPLINRYTKPKGFGR